MSEYVDKAMELAGNWVRAWTHDLDGSYVIKNQAPVAEDALRTHLESHDALLRQFALLRQLLEALESCDGIKGHGQFYDDKAVDAAIASLKQALEQK